MKHQYYEPGDGHTCREYCCPYCELAVCRVCGLFEGSLTTDCPGKPVSGELSDKIYNEKLDYRDAEGGWVNKLSPCQQSAVQVKIFDFYRGRSEMTEAQIRAKFGLSKEEYFEIRAKCLRYLYEKSTK